MDLERKTLCEEGSQHRPALRIVVSTGLVTAFGFDVPLFFVKPGRSAGDLAFLNVEGEHQQELCRTAGRGEPAVGRLFYAEAVVVWGLRADTDHIEGGVGLLSLRQERCERE